MVVVLYRNPFLLVWAREDSGRYAIFTLVVLIGSADLDVVFAYAEISLLLLDSIINSFSEYGYFWVTP